MANGSVHNCTPRFLFCHGARFAARSSDLAASSPDVSLPVALEIATAQLSPLGARAAVPQRTGISVLMPQVTAFVVFVLDCRICQRPVLGRNTARSVLPSPS